MATARNIMNPNVETIHAGATVAEALERMNDRAISSLMVDRINPRDTYGIVTMGDIVCRVVAKGLALNTVMVKEIMTKPVVVVLPDISVKHVARLFANLDISRAPVVDNNQLAGIITLHDILHDPGLIDGLL